MYELDEAHPRNLGFQVDWPVFVKKPFNAYGRQWKKGQHFPWLELAAGELQPIITLYTQGFIYHNRFLQQEQHVGDRIGELPPEKLKTLVRLLNARVKKEAPTVDSYNKRKCKGSQIHNKQQALLRRFLNNEPWIVDYFVETRDRLLGGTEPLED